MEIDGKRNVERKGGNEGGRSAKGREGRGGSDKRRCGGRALRLAHPGRYAPGHTPEFWLSRRLIGARQVGDASAVPPASVRLSLLGFGELTTMDATPGLAPARGDRGSRPCSERDDRPLPKPKALAAIERSLLVIIFHVLADPTVEFAELGADHYTHRLDRARRSSQLTHQLQALGYTVTLTTAA